MPTPFYHLCVAGDILSRLARPMAQDPALPEPARRWLEGQRCAFMLGNTAPDVQVVSGQSREATHFFHFPVEENRLPPWVVFRNTWPALAEPERLPPDQSAFLAGYLCHLLADWLWIKEIYAPVFGPDCAWDTFPHRLYLHNILRAHLDRQVLRRLPPGLGDCLEEVSPQGWLPFVQDPSLLKWRDFLSPQLQPGAAARTVEVFAQRQGLSPDEFHSLLDSAERMETEVFAHMPRQRLEAYRRWLVVESLQLVRAYLTHSLTQYSERDRRGFNLASRPPSTGARPA